MKIPPKGLVIVLLMASFWVTFEALAKVNPIKLLGVKLLTRFVSYPVLERLEKLFRIMKWSSLQNDQAYLHQNILL